MELFHLAETDKLRVFVDVPQVYAQDMQPGVPATLTLPQRPDRPLHGAVARTSGAINSASRTLRVEVDVDNQDGAFLPGAYALVDLDVTTSHPLLSVPVNTLLFRPNGVQVAVVNGTGKALLRTVTLGRDFGTTVEVTSELDVSERVISNPGDAIAPGDAVRVVGGSRRVMYVGLDAKIARAPGARPDAAARRLRDRAPYYGLASIPGAFRSGPPALRHAAAGQAAAPQDAQDRGAWWGSMMSR